MESVASGNNYTLYQGDCRKVLASLPEDSIETGIVDPPYGLDFMGAGWDRAVPGPDYWAAVKRVLKPGGSLFVFGGSRTFHRVAVALEDGGFTIADCLFWVYATGKPNGRRVNLDLTGAEAEAWEGYFTGGLKPSYEPILLAVKESPLSAAENARAYGVSGLDMNGAGTMRGTFPTNMILDRQTANLLDAANYHDPDPSNERDRNPSRYFTILDPDPDLTLIEESEPFDPLTFPLIYCPKADRDERDAGLDSLPLQPVGVLKGRRDGSLGSMPMGRNPYYTVKPIELMRHLARLSATPEGGAVLDCFMGTGSTGIGAVLEGRPFIGIDNNPLAVNLAKLRLDHWTANRPVKQLRLI